jgi:hypothetical protein
MDFREVSMTWQPKAGVNNEIQTVGPSAISRFLHSIPSASKLRLDEF